jgi:hypothetical protein
MVTDLQERMGPVLQELATALVQATPEWWTEATMRVEVQEHSDGTTGMSHSIASEQHPRDIVVATDEIFAATRELQMLCAAASKPWSTLVFRIKQVDEDWNFTTTFEYA